MKNFIRRILFLLYYKLFLARKNREVAYEEVGGFKITVLPTVFNPTEYISSELFVDFIKRMGDLTDKYVLDMGSGSGVVSVVSASLGAKCLAVDSNPMAVKTIAINARRNKFLEKINEVESNLFEKLPVPGDRATGGFDIMFFNPPYFKGIARNNFEKAFKGGEDYEVMRNFIRDSKSYLKPDGIIYFIVSSDMEISLLEQMFRSQGFEFVIERKIEKLLETFYITKAFSTR